MPRGTPHRKWMSHGRGPGTRGWMWLLVTPPAVHSLPGKWAGTWGSWKEARPSQDLEGCTGDAWGGCRVRMPGPRALDPGEVGGWGRAGGHPCPETLQAVALCRAPLPPPLCFYMRGLWTTKFPILGVQIFLEGPHPVS